MFIRDIMNTCPVVCTEEMPLVQVYQRMLENDCDHVAVIDSNSHKIPIGIITEHDICLVTIGKGRHPKDLTAGDVMNTRIAKALDTLTLTNCADLMQAGVKSKRLLVVDENGALCGTLTDADLERSKTNQHFEDLLSRAIAKEYKPSGINRIF